MALLPADSLLLKQQKHIASSTKMKDQLFVKDSHHKTKSAAGIRSLGTSFSSRFLWSSIQ
jgi:hypothetical protein